MVWVNGLVVSLGCISDHEQVGAGVHGFKFEVVSGQCAVHFLHVIEPGMQEQVHPAGITGMIDYGDGGILQVLYLEALHELGQGAVLQAAVKRLDVHFGGSPGRFELVDTGGAHQGEAAGGDVLHAYGILREEAAQVLLYHVKASILKRGRHDELVAPAVAVLQPLLEGHAGEVGIHPKGIFGQEADAGIGEPAVMVAVGEAAEPQKGQVAQGEACAGAVHGAEVHSRGEPCKVPGEQAVVYSCFAAAAVAVE